MPASAPDPAQPALVIRLGALGDLIFCQQAFHEIRQAHRTGRLGLLVRANFAEFARTMPWFDDILIDTHPKFAQAPQWLALRRQIRAFAPARIYDLQGKRRQNILYGLLGGPLGPGWSGAAPFCRFPRPWPPEPGWHFTDFMAAQLRAAGVPACPPADIGWLDAPVEKFDLPEKFALLVPGCSPAAMFKRWPPSFYAELARHMQQRGFTCVAAGGGDDAGAIAAIKAQAPQLVDLCGKTSLFELAGIARRAKIVIGNDTGPTHIAGAVGAPTLALFSGRGNPAWSHPPGPHVAWRQKETLAGLPAAAVIEAAEEVLAGRYGG